MALVIQTNVASLEAQKNLNTVSKGLADQLQPPLERLPHQHRRRRRGRPGDQRQLPRSDSLVLGRRAQRERRCLDGADR